MRLLPSSCGLLPSGFVLLPGPCPVPWQAQVSFPRGKFEDCQYIFPLTWGLSVTPWAVNFMVSDLIFVLLSE